MKYDIDHLDTCHSDYFQGSGLPVVQVMVDENTTYQDIKLELLNDYNTWHLEELDWDKYVEAVHELFANFTTLTYVPDTLYEVGNMEDYGEWDLYMYFTITTIEGEE
jgi:hypothetical protein